MRFLSASGFLPVCECKNTTFFPSSKKNICGDKILFLSLQNQNDDVMPTLMNVFGLRFFFYSEEHLPMHVHIQNSDGKAKIALNPDVVLV